MTAKILIGPNYLDRIKRTVDRSERYWRNSPSLPVTPPHAGDIFTVKALATIQPGQSGNCDVLQGPVGSEVKSNTATPLSLFNAMPEALTQDKFARAQGPYIIQALNPALLIKVILTAALPAGGSSASPTVDSWMLGDDPANLPSALLPLTIYPAWTQTKTIATGAKVTAIWDDLKQQYEALDWTC